MFARDYFNFNFFNAVKLRIAVYHRITRTSVVVATKKNNSHLDAALWIITARERAKSEEFVLLCDKFIPHLEVFRQSHDR